MEPIQEPTAQPQACQAPTPVALVPTLEAKLLTNSLQALKSHNPRLVTKAHIPHTRLTQQKQLIKCLVSLRTDDFQETSTEKYIPIHIICVIDVSGSMQGEKIKLVRASLEYVIGKMSGQDTITLIAFNQEATVLAEYAQAEDMAVRIQKLTAGGNTNIRQGLEYAYNVVKKYAKERMMQSIWLLTDGQDTNGFTGKDVAPQLLSHFGGKSCPFVAHTFGYGRDHDPTIMKMLSKAQSGNFKYIENTLELADAVGTALGGAESAIAREVTIVVKPGKFQGAHIAKCFGESFDYNPTKKEYSITQYFLRAGSDLSYVFVVELPAYTPGMVLDPTQPYQLLVATAEIKPLNPDEASLTVSAELCLPILDPTSPGLPFSAADPQVLQWYFRAISIDQMRKASLLLDQRSHEQGKKVLQALDAVLEKDAPQTEKLLEVRTEVKSMIEQIDKRQYEEGRRRMTEKACMYERCYDKAPVRGMAKMKEAKEALDRS